MGGKRVGSTAKIDSSVPFGFLLGKRYSGYKQAINTSRNLKPMPSKLPKLFWGLSTEQRRVLAARMLEAGHSGDALERAIRLAIWGESSSRRSIRVPSRSQPWDNPHKIEGGLNRIGPDARPIVPERFRPREPFLLVKADEVHTFDANHRVEKPHERADCGPARRRRVIQENMRARVQVQEDYLAGLEQDRREWRRYQIQAVKTKSVAVKQRRLRMRLAYGTDLSDGIGSDITSCAPEFEELRREKQELARTWRAVRQAELKANGDSARMRRWEKEVLRTIRAETSKSLSAPGTSFERENAIRSGGDEELARALHQLSVEHAVDGYTQPSPECGGKNFENDEGGEGPEVTPGPGGDGGTGVQGELAVGGGSAEATVQMVQPLLVGDGEAETDRTTTQQFERETASAGGVEAARDSGKVRLAGGTKSGAARAEVGGAPAVGCTRAPAASEEKSQAEEAEKGDEAMKNMVEKLLRTSSSVALAVARPLSIKPPPVLEAEEDPHQVNLASRIGSRKPTFPPPPRAKSGRAFVGGGYRTNPSTPSQRVSSSECRGNKFLEQEPFETCVTGGGGVAVVGGVGVGVGGGGGGGGGRVAGVMASCLIPNVNGEGRKGNNRRESGVATGGGILDLEAVTEAAGRLNGTGGHNSPSLVNRVPHNPRNRFAPMAESEVARFLQQGDDRYLSSAAGNGAGGGHEIIGLNEDHGTPAAAAATAGGAGTGIGRRLLVVGESTGRDVDGARTVLVSASGDARLFRPSSTPLDGWNTNQSSTTGIERRERS
ncbi:unnamed protein product [Ectocarpus sp. 4 AP-2014]